MRKTTMALGLVACFVCGSAGAAVLLTPQQPGQAPGRIGKELYRETERGPAYSLVEIPVGGQGFSSMVALLSAVYDIAKERGFAYAFAPTQAASISPAAGGAPAMAMMKVFMTRNRETSLRELLARTILNGPRSSSTARGGCPCRSCRGCSKPAIEPRARAIRCRT